MNLRQICFITFVLVNLGIAMTVAFVYKNEKQEKEHHEKQKTKIEWFYEGNLVNGTASVRIGIVNIQGHECNYNKRGVYEKAIRDHIEFDLNDDGIWQALNKIGVFGKGDIFDIPAGYKVEVFEQMLSEPPYVPFYQPYGMSHEEYIMEKRLAENKYQEWEASKIQLARLVPEENYKKCKS